MKKLKRPLSILLSLLMVVSLFAMVPVTASAAVGELVSENEYLTFTAEEAGSSVTLNYASGTLKYNKNNSGWVDYTKGAQIDLENEGDSVRFRGKNTTFDSSNHVSLTGKVACSGNVMSLRLDDDGRDQGLSDSCFYRMFSGCAGLTTAPELPETMLESNCYNFMFASCTSLTTAPELPAKALAKYCYRCMFQNCTSLTTAPELPATTLAKGCYNNMFYGCTSLTTAPELPATELAEDCYCGMFEGCTSLTTAPELPATTLVTNCYTRMFYGCSSIKLSETETPEYSIPYRVPPVGTGTTATYALYNMFARTGGTFAGTPKINTTYYLYREVPKYTVTWKNGDTTLETDTDVAEGTMPEYNGETPVQDDDETYTYTFSGWTDGTNTYGKDDTLPAVTGDITYTATFTATGAVGDYVPESDYLTFTAVEAGSSVTLKVASGSNLQYSLDGGELIPYTPGTPITLENAGDSVRFRGKDTTFNSSNHVSIGGKVACSGNVMSLRLDDNGRDQGLSDRCFIYMFRDCNGLTAAPELPETTLAPYCYDRMFYDCKSLTAAPALPATTLAEYCYSCMFSGCDSLTTAPALPATMLASNCYNSMFLGCESLTTAPELPATTLAEYCYDSMFYGCSSIKLSETKTDEYSIPYSVPSGGNGTTAENALKDMFAGTGGTFTGTPTINTTYYLYKEVPKYTVTWKNWDGNVIKTDENVAKGTMPEYNGTTPVKDDDATYTYTFSGWSPEVTEVTGDAEYTATFTAENKAVKNVITLINALPAKDDLTLAHEEQIKAARAAYNALSFAEKELVPDDAFIRLSGTEVALNSLKRNAFSQYRGDQADSFYIAMDQKIGSGEAELMNALQEAISAIQNVEFDSDKSLAENKAAVDAAVQAQTEVMNNKMTEACNAYKAKKTAEVQGLAQNGDPDPVYTVIQIAADRINGETFENQTVSQFKRSIDSAVEQAQVQISYARAEAFGNYKNEKAYDVQGLAQEGDSAAAAQIISNAVQAINAVSYDTSKTYVENKAAVDAAVDIAQITQALAAQRNADKAAAVTAQINALPAEITLNDKAAVEAAKQAYDALTDEQKDLVDREAFNKLVGAMNTIEKAAADQAAADPVINQINALPTVIILEDKADVEAARAAYNDLTDAQKALVDEEALDKLTEAEEVIADREGAKVVEDMINALPDAKDITLADKAAVNAANEARLNLPPEQADYLTFAAIDKLFKAMDKIEDLEAAKAVEDQINALPENITVEDKEAVEAARAAFDALTDDQRALVDVDALSEKLAAAEAALKVALDKAAADAVIAQIDALPAATRVTINDKDAIEAASAAYDALTDDQKNYVPLSSKLKLTIDKGALDAAIKIAEDEAAADAVEKMIEELPAPADVTLDDKTAVEDARAAYDALTNAQKRMVNLTDRVKLTADEAAIQKIENDIAAADAVTEQINALPAAEDITLDDARAVMAARGAYNNLTDDQKAYVDDETVQKLTDVEDALAEKVEVATVIALIDALPAAEDVTLADRTVIDSTGVAYDLLTDDQKAQIDPETAQKLFDAQAALAKIDSDMKAADEVAKMINDLPSATNVTLNDKDAIEAASAAYDALTDAQKDYVPLSSKLKLTVDKGALDAAIKIAEDEAAADAVEKMIEELPAPADVTLDDKTAVEDARAAYDALTNAQKRMVNLTDRVKLTADEAAIQKIENDIAAADAVTEQINALPAAEDITLDDARAVMAARGAYNNLTDDQKALVTDDTVQKLTDAEDAIVSALTVETVKTMMNVLPAAEDVTYNDKPFIEATRSAYDDLTDAQKAQIDDETLQKLTDAEDALALIEADKEAADAVAAMIEALPAATKVTLNDKDAIEAASAAYDELTDAQKAFVPAADKIKLAVDKGALDAAQKAADDEAAADAVEKMIEDLPAPADVTIDDKAAVEEARAAYDALTDAQKKLVVLGDRIKLNADEAAIQKIENDIAAAQAVTDMINALPAAEDVTMDDARDIITAAAAYNLLTPDQKPLVTEETVQKLKDAQDGLRSAAQVEIVKDMINELPAAEDVTLADKEDIETVRDAYDALTDAQKEKIDDETLQKLTDAEAALEQAEADKEAADAVAAMIEALPGAAKVTLNDKDAIEAAGAAYDELTDAQKDYVPTQDKIKLALDKAALEAAQKFADDEAAADAVEELIDALPAPDEITLDDKAAVEEAKAAYDALTPDQKRLVVLTDRIKLALDQAAIQKIENDIAAAQAVTDMINALPAAEDVTLDDANAITAATAAYNALTPDQKPFVTDETVQKLTDAQNALAKLEEAQKVKDQINALPAPEKITVSDKDAIEAARAAYDALDDAQKAQIDDETVQKLTDAEAALKQAEDDKAAADAVTEKIEALPMPTQVTLDDKAAIEEAKAAYDALTDAQKDYVPVHDALKLAFDEAALSIAETNAVRDMINALPATDDLTEADKPAVEAARKAYDDLTDEQKNLIDEDTLKKLTDAEEKLGHKILLGDANGDGVVDISDVTAIQMHVAELKVLEGDQLTAADVNLDGSVAIDDASILQVFLAETEVAYPIGQWI